MTTAFSVKLIDDKIGNHAIELTVASDDPKYLVETMRRQNRILRLRKASNDSAPTKPRGRGL